MDEQFKEIEGLLENVEQVQQRSFKKYAKLIIPHVALVTAVCLYAMCGAFLFYTLESPHEDMLKKNGVKRINDKRQVLTRMMFEARKRDSVRVWMEKTEGELLKFNEELYRAFKDEYVRLVVYRFFPFCSRGCLRMLRSKGMKKLQEVFEILSVKQKKYSKRPSLVKKIYGLEKYSDVRVKAIPGHSEPRSKRHRKSKSRTEKSEKMWTGSSALFFAATTMATIGGATMRRNSMFSLGYGNIVPVTPYGRITCVIFALFGAPLAIITIGDLGKFLSECTIWLYKKLRKMRKFVHIRYKRWKLRKSGVVIEADEESSSQSSKSRLEWDDLSMDKTEVPVLLVFAILLLYIAFGGVLFAFLESWTYMDAFYYCFVSLTTIGFGDIVPERHEYIVIMLVYLGVGLAVTTMCIDLVGIQYIQKIHYFGRKFRGTDLLHLLKRKRMLERRLAMGQGEEILQMYLQQMTQENRQEFRPPPILIADQCYVENEEEKYSMRSDRKLPSFRLDAVSCNDSYMLDFPVADRLRSPTVYSMRSIKSFYTNSSASARSLMYKRGLQTSRGDSWVESGPDLSFHCSLSPSPSIHQRQQMYDNYKSPEPSVLSFEYQFRLPSPDLKEIAEKARAARRNMSCPNSFRPIISPRVPPLSPITPTVRKRSLNPLPSARVHFAPPPYCCQLSQHNYFEISEPFMLSKLAAQCDVLDRCDMHPGDEVVDFEMAPLIRDTGCMTDEPPDSGRDLAPLSVVQPPEVQIHIPKLDIRSPPESSRQSKSRWRALFDGGALRVFTRPKKPVLEEEEKPLPVLKRKRQEKAKRKNILSHIDWLNISPRTNLMDAMRSDLPKLFDHVRAKKAGDAEGVNASVVFVSPRNPMGMACMEEWDSYIKMLDEYCKPFVSPRPPEVVVEEASMEESMPFEQIPEEPEGLEEIVSPMAPESTSSSSAATPSPLFDIDLGAFELVDSGVSAEALLSHDDPVIFHKDMPVHSVHHDTVQTEAALENLMNAPSSMLSSVVPPTMVADNYCFVVDGDKVRMGDIMGDDQWWRHTSRPTRYFYSDDLKKFHRVNCIMAKGKVISARLAGGASTSSIFNNPSSSSSSSSHNTPRSSLSTARSGRGEKVNLKHVYKVIRFYSFWKTCTSFHRIVTMIDKVSNDDKNANPQFRRRLFVQYLWRNAKAVEKARVQKEFDPRRQRLLRFVTDPASRKRIAGKK
ncbi:hypothetical protein L596_002777 [Steinernema carpocapsae]|uniref:Potassium channel domain-containing protein n=1 Tax=Steinernema carpocapsae TaxID=34508 RepID=A0A4U8UT49_STECR|nr:hypothetical protein L596_002777 [Steinernema carpocapsae]